MSAPVSPPVSAPVSAPMSAPVRDRMLDAIYRAVDGLNEALPPESRLARAESERILGEEAKIDSLGFVTLMVSVESEVQAAFGDCPSLAEELTATDVGVVSIGGLADFLASSFERKVGDMS